MESLENQKLLKELNGKAEEIRNECSLLQKTIKTSGFAEDTDTTVFSGFTEYLQTLFDEFSRIANQIHALEDPEELNLLKKDIAVFYSRFIKMQNKLRIIDTPQYDLSKDDDWDTDDSLDDEEDAVSEESEELLEDDFSEVDLPDPTKPKKKKSYKLPAKATTIEEIVSDQSRSAYITEESDRLEEQRRQDAMRYEQYRKNHEQQVLYTQRFNEQNGNATLQSLSLSEQKAESERRRTERQRQDRLAETDSDKISIRKSQSEIEEHTVSDFRAPEQHFNYNVLYSSQEDTREQAYRNPKKGSTGPALSNGSVSHYPGVNYTTPPKTYEHPKSDPPNSGTARASLNMAAIPGALTNAFTTVALSHRYSQLDQYRLQQHNSGTDVRAGSNRYDQESGNRKSHRAGSSKEITPKINAISGPPQKNKPGIPDKKPLLFNDNRRRGPWESADRPGRAPDRRKGPWEPDKTGKSPDRRKEPWELDDRPGRASGHRVHNQPTNPNRVSAEAEAIRAAEKKSDLQQKSKRITYKLKSIKSDIGYGVTATVRSAGQRYLDKLDNDDIRYAMKADYYRYIGIAAIGVSQGMLKNPSSDLKLNATAELSSRQMAKYNSAAIRNGRNLKAQIENEKAKYDALSPKDKKGAKGKELRSQINKLKSQIPSADKAAAVAKNVQSFQHERAMDQKVLSALSDKNGKVSKRLKTIDARGNEFLKAQKNQMQKRFDARYQVLSDRKAREQIQKLSQTAKAKKLQIELLERQGSKLTAADRVKLLSLKGELKANGKEIGKLKFLLQNRSDLAYLEKQVGSVLQRARKYQQSKRTLVGLVRNTMLRPLYNPENNTEYLAKAISLPYNPLVQSGYRVAKATVSAPVKVVSAGIKKFTPNIYNHFHFAQDQFSAWKQQLKKGARKEIYLQKQRLWDRLPGGMQNYWKQIRQKMDACKKVNVEFHQRIRRMKEWAEKTRLMKLRRAAQRELKQITEYFQKAGRLFKAVCIKGLIAVILVGVIAAAIPTFSAIISTYFTSIIASPNETEDGKIDLSAYTQIYMSEKQRFSRERNSIEESFYDYAERNVDQFFARWQRPPKSRILTPEDEIREQCDADIKIEYVDENGSAIASPSENHREIIAMMAVRIQNDLEDPIADDYMRFMSKKSQMIKQPLQQELNFCDGCVEIKILVEEDPKEPDTPPPKKKPGGDGSGGGSHVVPGIRSLSIEDVPSTVSVVEPGSQNPSAPDSSPEKPKELVYETITVCPGHPEMKLQIHVLTLDELYEADDFDGLPDWEGWTEENRDWVQLLLDMDWDELYSGFHIFVAGSALWPISSEDEARIWDSLNTFTGNPYATAGIMGNLMAESRLSSTNLQDSYEAILGFTDESYTAAVDSGTYQNFVNDAAGYGLAQWTYHTRKENLLRLARQRGTSIGDLGTQLQMLKNELSGMKSTLAGFGSVADASNYILDNFERPQDPEATRSARINYSSYFYNKFVLGVPAEGDLTWAQKEVCNIAMNSGAYGIPARGGYCQQWAAYVYAKAGFALDNSASARQSGDRYGISTDFALTPPGAAVYGYSSSKYGHVGIYVGGGKVYHNIGGVAVDSLADWIRKYNGYCWGWEGGTDLTQQ